MTAAANPRIYPESSVLVSLPVLLGLVELLPGVGVTVEQA